MGQEMKYFQNLNKTSLLYFLVLAMFFLIVGWASIFQIDKSINVTGELSPLGRPIVVQNRFEGKLTSGPYTIVAQTFDQNILGDFIVHIYSDDGELVADRCRGRNGGAGGQWIKNERKQYVCL